MDCNLQAGTIRAANMEPPKAHCDFCGKRSDFVAAIITGPHGAVICDECVDRSVETLANAKQAKAVRPGSSILLKAADFCIKDAVPGEFLVSR